MHWWCGGLHFILLPLCTSRGASCGPFHVLPVLVRNLNVKTHSRMCFDTTSTAVAVLRNCVLLLTIDVGTKCTALHSIVQ